MKKILSLLIIFGFLSFTSKFAYSQYENTSSQRQEGTVKKRNKPPQEKRFFVGGMLGAGFSSISSYVDVSAIFGFEPIKNLQFATRLTYIYESRFVQNVPQNTRVNLHHYGASIFGRYIIFKGFFAQAEYEILSFNDEWYDLNTNSPTYKQKFEDRIPIYTLFVGAGYFQRFENGGFASFAVLFPVVESHPSFYKSYVIRFGFGGFF